MGDVFRNTIMKRVSGTKKSISHQALGDVLEYFSGQVNVKHKHQHLGDMFGKYSLDR